MTSCRPPGPSSVDEWKGLPRQAGAFRRTAAVPRRDQHQHQDGGEIGQHGHHLGRDAEAAGALGVELQDGDAAEEVGADQRPPGRQAAKTTSASAIQPRPAVMFSAHMGV